MITETSAELQILNLLTRKSYYEEVKNFLSKDMFPDESGMIFDTLMDAHSKYGGDISLGDVAALHHERYPAMPRTARQEVLDLIDKVMAAEANPEVGIILAEGVWRRNKAREIGEHAVDIFTGKSEDFGTILRLVEQVSSENISTSDNLILVDSDLQELIGEAVQPAEFQFTIPTLTQEIDGLDRGHLGIIFARPEVGKTSLCSFLTANYLDKHTVAYFANEEPAGRVKIRIAGSYLKSSVDEINNNFDQSLEQWLPAEGNLQMFDSTGVDFEEITRYVELNKPDIVFIDQLDKVKIKGDFNRGDERLKEIYVQARELAKKNNCLVWAVSQANYDAHRTRTIDYSMLDNSRTGKAGEADVIIGIAKTENGEEENGIRRLAFSKNKVNGWHGFVDVLFDQERAVFAA